MLFGDLFGVFMKQKLTFETSGEPTWLYSFFFRIPKPFLAFLAVAFVSFSSFGSLAQEGSSPDAASQLQSLQQALPSGAESNQDAATSIEPPSLSDLLDSADGTSSPDNQAAAVTPDLIGTPPPEAPNDAETAKEERKEAFKGAADTMLPLKPAEIRRLLELYDETTQAAEAPIYTNPEPESSFVQASLEPGAKPVEVKAAVGNVTTISIVDVTGQPWPIQDMTWAGDFQIEQPDSGSHMIRISPNAHFAQGNVSLRLVGLNPPVIMTLHTERKTVHVRLDVQIPEVGPKGVLPPVLTPVSIKAGDDEITKVLLGTTTQAGLTKLSVEGVDGRTSAYQTTKGDVVYVRTPYTLLSPAWTRSVQSADGLHVYALNNSPVLLLSDKGKMLRAYLSPMEQSNGQ